MIRYYFVKVVATATAENTERAGEVITYIYGKESRLVYCNASSPWMKRDDLDSYYFVNEYGYKYEHHAKRSCSFKHPTNSKYWTETAEIVSVDVEIKAKSKQFDGRIKYSIHRNFTV